MKELASLEAMPLETLREQVLDGLVQRYSREGVTMEDFERRTSLATRALTKAEVLGALDGLPEEGPAYPSPAPRASAPPSTAEKRAGPETEAAAAGSTIRAPALCGTSTSTVSDAPEVRHSMLARP